MSEAAYMHAMSSLLVWLCKYPSWSALAAQLANQPSAHSQLSHCQRNGGVRKCRLRCCPPRCPFLCTAYAASGIHGGVELLGYDTAVLDSELTAQMQSVRSCLAD
jgi:hypothetical protein